MSRIAIPPNLSKDEKLGTWQKNFGSMFQQDWFLKLPANQQRQITENEISNFNQLVQEAKNIQLKQRIIGLSEKTREEFYSSTFGNPLYSEQVK